MFVGHYGVSYVARRVDDSIPLWVLFVSVQLLDIVWAPLVILGVEKVRIVPGFTATNPLDLYFMPYTHSLVAAILWSAVAAIAYRSPRRSSAFASVLVGNVHATWLRSNWVRRGCGHRDRFEFFRAK